MATFVVGIGVGTAGTLATTPSPAPQDKEFALIREAWDTLHKQYVARAELDDQALAWGSIKGMTQAVGDTGHTSFMTPAERAANAAGLSGSYVGIGVKVDTAEDGRPLIITVFKDSPAEKAGLLAGDIVVSVDGKTTTGHEISEVIDWIRGEAGTKVTVTVRNGVDGKDREYTLERADVPVQSVSWTMVPGSRTALLALDTFSNGAADETVDALKAIKAAGADRLILDLRGNPGGYVNEAVGVASQFLTKGDVYIERDADGHETHHPVSADGVATDIPMVVLVDANTASSAEIVSGRAAGREAGRDHRHRDLRHGHRPRRVPAVRRVGDAHRHGRVAHPERPPHLARGHRPGCGRGTRHGRRGGQPRRGPQLHAGAGRRGQGPAAGQGAQPGGVDLLGVAVGAGGSSRRSSGSSIERLPPSEAGTGATGFADRTSSLGGFVARKTW